MRTDWALDLYFLFHTIVSLIYISAGNSIYPHAKPECTGISHFAFTKHWIAPATFLPHNFPFTLCIIRSISSNLPNIRYLFQMFAIQHDFTQQPLFTHCQTITLTHIHFKIHSFTHPAKTLYHSSNFLHIRFTKPNHQHTISRVLFTFFHSIILTLSPATHTINS